MKLKDHCQECGKYMCKKKLKKSTKDKRILCLDCFKKMCGIRLEKNANVPLMNNVSEKERKALRVAKIRKKCNYLDRNDVSFLKDKYGSKSPRKINKLFKYWGVHRTQDVLDNSESNDRLKRENRMKDFLGELK